MKRGPYDLELTKILAKTMQSSYKRKQIGEMVLRILQKVETVMLQTQDNSDLEALRAEFTALRQEAYLFMNP